MSHISLTNIIEPFRKPIAEWPDLARMAMWQFPLMLVLAFNIGLSVMLYWGVGHSGTILRRWWQQLPLFILAVWGVVQLTTIGEADFFILILVLLLPMSWRLEATQPVPQSLSPAGLTITIFLVGSVFIYQTQFFVLLGMIIWLLSFLLWFTMALTGFRLTDLSVRWLPVIGLSAAAATIIVLLFTLLPRLDTGFLPGLSDTKEQVRLVDSLEPGGMADLLADETVAFRAFPNRTHAAPPDYWRVFILDIEQNGNWRRGARQRANNQDQWVEGSLPDFDQQFAFTISADRHDMKSLPVPGWPLATASNYQLNNVGELQSRVAVAQQQRQVAVSGFQSVYLASDMPVTTKLSDANPRLQAWAKETRSAYPDDKDFINAVLSEFQQRFVYNTQINLPSLDPLDHFFFTSQQGYCSTFASTMTTILRAAGIPAHIATGYLGGAWNPYGDFWVVRNADAHAWVEARLANGQWLRFDPTLAVMPVSLDRFQGLAERGADIRPQEQELVSEPRALTISERFRQASLWVDAINIQMTQAILQYGQDSDGGSQENDLRLIFTTIGIFIAFAMISVFFIAIRVGRLNRLIPRQEKQLEWLLSPYIGARPVSMSLTHYAAMPAENISDESANLAISLAHKIYAARFSAIKTGNHRRAALRALNKELRLLRQQLSKGAFIELLRRLRFRKPF